MSNIPAHFDHLLKVIKEKAIKSNSKREPINVVQKTLKVIGRTLQTETIGVAYGPSDENRHVLLLELGSAENPNVFTLYRKRFDSYEPIKIATIPPAVHTASCDFIDGLMSDLSSIVNSSMYKKELLPELEILLRYLKKAKRHTTKKIPSN